ncbi:MAG TPA: hypothetical protein VF845_09600 [Terriglobales bacterium]
MPNGRTRLWKSPSASTPDGIFTLDCYAWALHVNGQDPEARRQIEAALAVGIRNAMFYRHAGEIALAVGDRSAAERYLRQSAELNTSGSEQARVVLAGLAQPNSGRVAQ